MSRHFEEGFRQCICCGVKLKVMLHSAFHAAASPKILEGDVALVEDGGFVQVSFGYGSGHDTDELTAFICDQCAVPFVDSMRAPFYFDSVFGSGAPYSNIQPRYTEEQRMRIYSQIPRVSLEELANLETPAEHRAKLSWHKRILHDIKCSFWRFIRGVQNGDI